MTKNATGVGRLTADPELKYTEDGMAICTLRVAYDKARGRDGTNYVTVKAFGAMGEAQATHLLKGRQIYFSGNLELERWMAGDGTNRSQHVIMANEIQWLAKPRAQSDVPVGEVPVPDGEPFDVDDAEEADEFATV